MCQVGTALDFPFSQGDPFIGRDIVLHLAAIPDGGLRAYDHVLPDAAVFAYGGSFQDMGEVPELSAFSDLAALINLCRRMCADIGGS